MEVTILVVVAIYRARTRRCRVCQMTFILRIAHRARWGITLLAKAWLLRASNLCALRIRTTCQAWDLGAFRIETGIGLGASGIAGTWDSRAWYRTWLCAGSVEVAALTEVIEAGLILSVGQGIFFERMVSGCRSGSSGSSSKRSSGVGLMELGHSGDRGSPF